MLLISYAPTTDFEKSLNLGDKTKLEKKLR